MHIHWVNPYTPLSVKQWLHRETIIMRRSSNSCRSVRRRRKRRRRKKRRKKRRSCVPNISWCCLLWGWNIRYICISVCDIGRGSTDAGAKVIHMTTQHSSISHLNIVWRQYFHICHNSWNLILVVPKVPHKDSISHLKFSMLCRSIMMSLLSLLFTLHSVS